MTIQPVSTNGIFITPREDWLAQHVEDAIDPTRPIVDAHHHLWDRDGSRYLIPEYAKDVASGHNVVASVYVDCHSMYRPEGPIPMRPVGEVEFARDQADIGATGDYGATRFCAGIVGHADLLLGDAVRDVLEAEIVAGRGQFRGIRYSCAWDEEFETAGIYAKRNREILRDPAFRRGFAQIAPLGLTYDTWLFQPQIDELTELAQAFPSTQVILDHCGGPAGIARFADNHDAAFATWRTAILKLAQCPNVVIKLGGLGMGLLGLDFHMRDMPPSSEQLSHAWRPYIETCIEAFGANRCMFESNYPADKGQCSFQVMFNAFKRITAACSEHEKTALFAGTAMRVYRLKE